MNIYFLHSINRKIFIIENNYFNFDIINKNLKLEKWVVLFKRKNFIKVK